MIIADFKHYFRRSEYGNTFFFVLPFLNFCFYKGEANPNYTTVTFGWLVFTASFYIIGKEKAKQ